MSETRSVFTAQTQKAFLSLNLQMSSVAVPIFTISFCYTGIFRIARNTMKKCKGKVVSKDKEDKQRKLEYKLAKTTAVSIICFVVSWAPYASIAVMGVFGKVSGLLAVTRRCYVWELDVRFKV